MREGTTGGVVNNISLGGDILRKKIYPRGHWKLCQGIWRGSCYRSAKEETFAVIKPQEKDCFDLTFDSNKKKYLVARNSDNMLVPFQCDFCHFRNLVKRDPVKSDEDLRLIIGIRRANLDDFWARKEGTVSATKRDGWKLCKVGKEMGLSTILPKMESFPLKDTQGMSLVVSMLRRSLDKGRCRATVQFGMVRK